MGSTESQPLADTPLSSTNSAQAEAHTSYITATKKCTPCHTTKPLYMFFSEPQGDVAIGKICYCCRLLPQIRREIQKALASKAKPEVRVQALEFARVKIEKWHANVDAVVLTGQVDERQTLLEFCAAKADTLLKNPVVEIPAPKPSKLKHTFPTPRTASGPNKRVKTDNTALSTPATKPSPKIIVKTRKSVTFAAEPEPPRRSTVSTVPTIQNSRAEPAPPPFSDLTENDLRAKVAANKARLAALEVPISAAKAKQARLATASHEHSTWYAETERLRAKADELKIKQKAAIDAYNEALKRCTKLEGEMEGLQVEVDAAKEAVQGNGEVKALREEQVALYGRLLEIGREAEG